MITVRHTEYGTSPVLVHAHGSHDYKPHWLPIKEAFFAEPPQSLAAPADLTVITCNNGHQAMGIFERSVAHLGIPYEVHGRGIPQWVNARDKPRVLLEALAAIPTRYVLYADSRDAILIGDPALALQRFQSQFQARLVFGADRINWPPINAFQRHEKARAASVSTDFPFLNGGMWIGETAFCKQFFEYVMETDPMPEAPESEQGILKKLLPEYPDTIALDYHCHIFLNIGFLTAPVLEIEGATLTTMGEKP